jgi:hypothetical protein
LLPLWTIVLAGAVHRSGSIRGWQQGGEQTIYLLLAFLEKNQNWKKEKGNLPNIKIN